MAVVTGDAIIDFGANPTGYAAVDVTGEASITVASKVEAYLDPILATALSGFVNHNAEEHAVAEIKISCTDLVAGVGFTIRAFYRFNPGLTGTWAVSWVYTT